MINYKRLAALAAVFCLLATGCGERQSAAPPANDGLPLPEESPFVSEPTESIDPLEEAARLSTPESARGEASEEVSPPSAPESEVPEPEPAPSSRAQPPSSIPEESAPLAAPSILPSSPELAEPPAADPARSAAAQIEQELLQLINAERTDSGLEALGVQESMQFAAEIRAAEALQSLSHTRPDGTAYHTAFDEAGFVYAGKWHGENLALIRVTALEYSESAVAAALFAEWSQSAGHHQNMLGEHFYQTGIGVYIQQEDDSLRIGSSQLFAGL